MSKQTHGNDKHMDHKMQDNAMGDRQDHNQRQNQQNQGNGKATKQNQNQSQQMAGQKMSGGHDGQQSHRSQNR